MNKKIKKIIAITVSAWEVFSQFSVGFCSGTSDPDKTIFPFGDLSKSDVEDTSEDKVPAKTLAIRREESSYGSKVPTKALNIRREEKTFVI